MIFLGTRNKKDKNAKSPTNKFIIPTKNHHQSEEETTIVELLKTQESLAFFFPASSSWTTNLLKIELVCKF